MPSNSVKILSVYSDPESGRKYRNRGSAFSRVAIYIDLPYADTVAFVAIAYGAHKLRVGDIL